MSGSGITGLTNLSALGAQQNIQKHTTNASDQIAKLGSGSRLNKASDDPSSAAIVKTMSSTLSVLNQVKVNSSNAASLIQVASGAMSDQLNLLTNLQTLAAQSADASLSPTSRSLVNQSYQQLLSQVDDVANRARWNGVSLMTGGSGTVTAAGVVAAAQSNIAAPTTAAPVSLVNTLSGANTAVTGFVQGAAQAASVSISSATGYNVSVEVGGQWFSAQNVVPVGAGTFTLHSTVDSAATLTLEFAAAVTDITSAATFQAGLEETLGLTIGRQPATFVAQSTAVSGGLTSVAASSNTPVGNYSLRYDPNSSALTLTNGTQKWTQAISALVPAAAQSITFANGVTANVDNTFAAGTAITPYNFSVAPNATNQVSLTFQVAELSTDTLTVNIGGTTNAALGVNGTSVDTIANANIASDRIGKAINQINASYAQLGAQQKRLESTQGNLETTTSNLEAARSNVSDVDIAKAMTDFTIANTMAQISEVALSQSLDQTKQLLSVVRS